jgi:hypothetical protein
MPLPLSRTVAVIGFCILTRPIAGFADEPTRSAPNAGAPGRAGSWVRIDPQTGNRVPTGPRAAIAADPAFSTSHQGLLQQPAPGGGMMIDLQGRFRSAAVAEVGPDGKAHVGCVPPGAAPLAK